MIRTRRLPEHDVTDAQFLLSPSASQVLRLVAAGKRIQYLRRQTISDIRDADPYSHGYFGFHTRPWSDRARAHSVYIASA